MPFNFDDELDPAISKRDLIEVISASTLASAMPLIATLRYLVDKKIIEQKELEAYFSLYMDSSKYSGNIFAIVDPAWKSFFDEIIRK